MRVENGITRVKHISTVFGPIKYVCGGEVAGAFMAGKYIID